MCVNWKKYTIGALLACMPMLMLGGCGDDDATTPTGQVVKGPVDGATVNYSDGTSTRTVKGFYAYKGLQVDTTGGTYIDIKGNIRNAPDLGNSAGNRNVTPLTLLYRNASEPDKAKLLALLGGAGIDTVVVGEISSSNVLIAKLNESLGEVLTQIKEGNATASQPYLAGLAAQVATLTPDTAIITANIISAINANTVTAPVTINTTAVTDIAEDTIPGVTVPTAPTTPTTPTGQNLNITANGTVNR